MKSTHDAFGYSAMIHEALREVVRKTLLRAQEFGMPTDHHFYISFKTMAAQVVLPLYLRQKYPESMTIVLQYQFHNLRVGDKGFSVALGFGGKFETLYIPFSAIEMFSDPEAELVLNFQENKTPTKNHSERQGNSVGNGSDNSSDNASVAYLGSIAYGTQNPLNPAASAKSDLTSGLKPSGLTLSPSGLKPSGLPPGGLKPSGLPPSGLTPSGLTPVEIKRNHPKAKVLTFRAKSQNTNEGSSVPATTAKTSRKNTPKNTSKNNPKNNSKNNSKNTPAPEVP